MASYFGMAEIKTQDLNQLFQKLKSITMSRNCSVRWNREKPFCHYCFLVLGIVSYRNYTEIKTCGISVTERCGLHETFLIPVTVLGRLLNT